MVTVRHRRWSLSVARHTLEEGGDSTYGACRRCTAPQHTPLDLQQILACTRSVVICLNLRAPKDTGTDKSVHLLIRIIIEYIYK